MKNTTWLEIRNLTKKYGNVHALKKVNLKFEKGGCYGILGANGAGKTTLLMIITNLIRKYQGTCEIEDIKGSFLGFLPENWGFFPYLSPVEHLEYFYKLRTYSKPTKETIQSQLEWVGIEKEFWNKKPRTYSKGMKQRLGLALAFIGAPKFVVLDEPFAHIDPLGRQHLLREIKRYQREHSAIIIMSSHVISEIEQVVDYITILDHGNVLVSEDFLELSLQHDGYEFDIVSLTSNQEYLESFFTHLKGQNELKFTDIRLTKGKILINTKHSHLIHSYLAEQSKDLFIRPTSGFLDKFYMDILEGLK